MKELSIEEKAKRYDEAYKVAKNIHIFSSDLAEIKRMEEIFPELKEESEGERIRKKICKILLDNVPYEEAQEYIAWLEKQYEQNLPIEKLPFEMKTVSESLGFTTQKECDDYNKMVTDLIMSDDGKDEQKSANKVEPQFHEGDWVVYNNNGCICQIKSIRENDYCLWPLDSDVEGYFKTTYIDNEYHLWTIQEAKEGDVLATDDGNIFVFDGTVEEAKYPFAYYGLIRRRFESYDRRLPFTHNNVHPATKEQRDQLEKAMADAGYTFDFEKKELKKIKQNNAWDEDGERIILAISQLLKDCESENGWNCVYSNDREVFFADMENWLKSIKDRVGCEVNCTTTKEWKPSDEQMNALDSTLQYSQVSHNYFEHLNSLFNDLKKLREE